MPNSVDVFRLDINNIIIYIRYNDHEITETHAIKWSEIRSIKMNEDSIIIFHNGIISSFPINLDVMEG